MEDLTKYYLESLEKSGVEKAELQQVVKGIEENFAQLLAVLPIRYSH